MDFAGYDGYFLLELSIYSVFSIILLKSIKANFEFAATTPISFWDDYTKKINLKLQSIEPKFVRSVIRRRVSVSPIKDKDKNKRSQTHLYRILREKQNNAQILHFFLFSENRVLDTK